MDAPPANEFCCVCHDQFARPCQANCFHWFCAYCILRVWESGRARQPCICPLCRRIITLLIPAEAAQQQHHGPEDGRILRDIERYNRSFGGGSLTLSQMLQDLPFFLRRLLRELMDPQRTVPFVFKARIVLAFIFGGIYVLSPVGIIPDGVFGYVGFFDDLLILLIVFIHLAAIYRTMLVN